MEFLSTENIVILVVFAIIAIFFICNSSIEK